MGFLKTIFIGLLVTITVPAAALSGIVVIGSVAWWYFGAPGDARDAIVLLCYAMPIFVGSMWVLITIQKGAQRLVKRINQETGLQFNPSNMLGFPSPGMLVFDARNRKIAICNCSTGQYKIYPLSYLLAWYCDWRNVSNMEFSGSGGFIPGTNLGGPQFQRVERRLNFMLVLEVADESNPILRFRMSEQSANIWCARLNAIVNG